MRFKNEEFKKMFRDQVREVLSQEIMNGLLGGELDRIKRHIGWSQVDPGGNLFLFRPSLTVNEKLEAILNYLGLGVKMTEAVPSRPIAISNKAPGPMAQDQSEEKKAP